HRSRRTDDGLRDEDAESGAIGGRFDRQEHGLARSRPVRRAACQDATAESADARYEGRTAAGTSPGSLAEAADHAADAAGTSDAEAASGYDGGSHDHGRQEPKGFRGQGSRRAAKGDGSGCQGAVRYVRSHHGSLPILGSKSAYARKSGATAATAISPV